jgi:hypothetical protein
MGRQTVDQSQLFYLFNLEEQIPADHPVTTSWFLKLLNRLSAARSVAWTH